MFDRVDAEVISEPAVETGFAIPNSGIEVIPHRMEAVIIDGDGESLMDGLHPAQRQAVFLHPYERARLVGVGERSRLASFFGPRQFTYEHGALIEFVESEYAFPFGRSPERDKHI